MFRSLNICFCSVNTSCKESRRCHKDELRQLTLTLGVVIQSGSVVLTPVSGFLCCAPVQFSHVQRLIVCRLAEEKVIAEELPRWIMKGCTLKSIKAPTTKTVFLLKLKFESLKCLNLLSRPLKSKPNRKMYTDPSVCALQKVLGKCIFRVLCFQIWIPNTCPLPNLSLKFDPAQRLPSCLSRCATWQ